MLLLVHLRQYQAWLCSAAVLTVRVMTSRAWLAVKKETALLLHVEEVELTMSHELSVQRALSVEMKSLLREAVRLTVLVPAVSCISKLRSL